MKNIKTIFIGTSDFGIPCFEKLILDQDFIIQKVITQPDKKVGRKQILTFSPIKKTAKKNNLDVWQPDKIKNITSKIKNLQPDIIVVIAYAQIIPAEILKIPKFGCINIHGSLLPKYRGASCIQAAILNNDSQTGITIMQMDKGLDTGPIIHQEKIKIDEKDNAGRLFLKLSLLSSKNINNIIKKYLKKELIPFPQDNNLATKVALIQKKDGLIQINKTAKETIQHIKAMSPWPGAFIHYQKNNFSKTIKIIKIKNKTIKSNKNKIGEFFKTNNDLAFQCKKDALIIEKIQVEGKKIISAEDFIKGYSAIIL